jgi:hypothetical protein
MDWLLGSCDPSTVTQPATAEGKTAARKTVLAVLLSFESIDLFFLCGMGIICAA